jgi:CSLREA domain-containing protein
VTASRMSVFSEKCLDLTVLSDQLTATTGVGEYSPSRRWPVALGRTVLFWLGVLLLGGLAQAQIANFSGAVTTLGGGFKYPAGVALDSSGNVYIADNGNNAVYEIPSGCASASCVITLGGGFNDPYGVAVDASGNVYVADTGNQVVWKMPPGCLSSSCVSALLGYQSNMGANSVAADASGNVYVYGNGVWEVPSGCVSSGCAIQLDGFLNGFRLEGYGIAVDSSGNVYVSDLNQGEVVELPHGCTASDFNNNTCTATDLGGIFDSPYGVALDLSGNIYVSANGTVYEMPPGCASTSCVTSIAEAFGVGSEGLAVDWNGNLYAGDPEYNEVQEIQRHGVNLGSVALGSTGTVATLFFNFTAADSGVTVSVLTQGAQDLDFANTRTGTTDTGNGTCDESGNSYGAGETCTVNVTFSPKFAGARSGAVQLSDATGVIATAYIYGTGHGPQLVFPNNQAGQFLGGGFYVPYGVAVDASGNVYVGDTGNAAVKKMPAGCASLNCVSTLGGGFGGPAGVAVDGAGNVYLGDSNKGEVKQMPPGCTSSTCVTTLGGSFVAPTGVAVDGAGNVYLADSGSSEVKEMPPGCTSSSCVTTLGSGFEVPYGVAVDGSGSVYVADLGNNAVKKMSPDCTSSSCVTILGGGFNQPYEVAVDASGNVYVADFGNHAVKEIPPGCTSSSCVTTLGTGFNYPASVAVDGSGNVYVADPGDNAAKELHVSSPPNLSFANSSVGSESSDSPQTVMLQNIGNAPLTFPASGTGENPSISANFAVDSSTTCPEVLTSSSPGTLAAGATCTLAVDFIPTTAGPINGTAVLTDNNLNVSSATQTINLSGTGLNATVSVSIGTNPAGLSFSINGTPYSSTQTPSLNFGTQYTLSTTSPQAGGPGVQYVFSQWSDGTMSLTDLLTPTASTSSDTAQFTAQYTLTVTAGSGGTIGASTAPNGFYNPATLQAIAATPNSGYYFAGWTGANSPGDITNATSAASTVTMNGPENLTANFAPIPTFQVTTLNDDATGNAANCTTPSPNCSLRDAITAIEANNGSTGNITFATGLNGAITLTSALPTLSGQMTITGPGASSLTVSGGNSQTVGSVFTVNSGATVAFSGITITGGNSVNGGGITNNGSTTVTNSAISGNTGGCGGAICTLVGTLTLSGSTISGNNAQFNGGAIVNGSTLTVINSTIANNTAHYDYGGGIFNNNGVLTVLNSTLSGNTSGQYGGGIYNAGMVTVSNSIVGGNTASNPGDDCSSCGTQSPYNLISTPSNIVNPNLAPLGNYGGPTQTMLPLPGSAAICAASSALIPAGATTDQRGFPNSASYNNTACNDLGAVQTNYAFSFTTEPPSTGTLPSLAMSPGPTVTVTESGSALVAGPVTVSLNDAKFNLTARPATTTTSTSNGQATFGALIFTGATSNDTLTATLALNTGLNLTTTSTGFSVAEATPTVTWPTASAITYGQTLASSMLSGGLAVVETTPVAGSFAFTNPSAVPSAGTQTESVTFTPSNTSAYNSVNGMVSLLVNKAMPTVTFTGAPANAPYGATFMVAATTNASTTAVITASGSCSIASSSVTITASSGTCSLTATWAADNNYVAASATQSTIATKATPLIT